MELSIIGSWIGRAELRKDDTLYMTMGEGSFYSSNAPESYERLLWPSGSEYGNGDVPTRSTITTNCPNKGEEALSTKGEHDLLYSHTKRKHQTYITSGKMKIPAAPHSPLILTDDLNIRYARSRGLGSEPEKSMLERFVQEFSRLLSGGTKCMILNAAGSNSSSTESTKSTETSAKRSASRGPTGKRMTKDELDDSTDGNNERSRHPKKCSADSVDEKHFNFACPYRKHDPAKYGLHTRFNCARSAWQDISRVKEHLYRVHRAPPYCNRCYSTFETPVQLAAHTRSIQCATNPGEPPEGITDGIKERLQRRKKSYRGQTEEDRWGEIYSTLFPGDTVPSPYFEPVPDTAANSVAQQLDLLNLNHFAAYSERETPRLVQSILEEEPEYQLINGPSINRIIRSYRERLISDYASQLHMDSSASSTIANYLPTESSSTTYSTTSDPSNANQMTYYIPPTTPESTILDFTTSSWDGTFSNDPQYELSGLDTTLSSLNHPDTFLEEYDVL